MTSLKTSLAILLILSVSACKVGPNYKRPATTVPASTAVWRLTPHAQPPARHCRHALVLGVPGRDSARPDQGSADQQLRHPYRGDARAAGERQRGHYSRQPVPDAQWFGFDHQRTQFAHKSHQRQVADLRQSRALAELHRRFLGTVPPRHRIRSCHLAGDSIRPGSRARLVDRFGRDQLLRAPPVRRPASILEKDRRGRQRDPEAQRDQVQRWRKCHHRRLPGTDTAATGRSAGHLDATGDRADREPHQHLAGPQSRTHRSRA